MGYAKKVKKVLKKDSKGRKKIFKKFLEKYYTDGDQQQGDGGGGHPTA